MNLNNALFVSSTFDEVSQRVRGQVGERVGRLGVQRRQRQHLVAAALLLFRHRLGAHAAAALAAPAAQRCRLVILYILLYNNTATVSNLYFLYRNVNVNLNHKNIFFVQ